MSRLLQDSFELRHEIKEKRGKRKCYVVDFYTILIGYGSS